MNKIPVFSSLNEVLPIIEATLSEDISIEIPASGYSMRPLLYDGRDSITIKKADLSSIKKGDVVLYRCGDGRILLHRIVKVKADSFDICGDAHWDIEKDIPKNDVIAIATSFLRKGKALSADRFFYKIACRTWILCIPLRKYIFKIGSKIKHCVVRK